jgi:hypothetical protein
MKNDCAILIVSCDKYRDLWEPFFTTFWAQWPDCPFPVYLQSNTVSYTGKFKKRVKNLLTGEDVNWSRSLKTTLGQFPEKYIFMWNEDLFLSSPISSALFSQYFSLMKKLAAKHIHYRCIPPADSVTENGALGVYGRGMPYRSIVMGFWDKAYLASRLLDGESPWQFEIMGSYRTSYDDGFFCATKEIIPFVHMAEKGKWQYEGVKYCREHNIPITLSARGLSTQGYLKSQVMKLYFNILLSLPWKSRLGVLNFFRKALVSY